jgi:hypothetical protein
MSSNPLGPTQTEQSDLWQRFDQTSVARNRYAFSVCACERSRGDDAKSSREQKLPFGTSAGQYPGDQ